MERAPLGKRRDEEFTAVKPAWHTTPAHLWGIVLVGGEGRLQRDSLQLKQKLQEVLGRQVGQQPIRDWKSREIGPQHGVPPYFSRATAKP
jgi:hypothetical protein